MVKTNRDNKQSVQSIFKFKYIKEDLRGSKYENTKIIETEILVKNKKKTNWRTANSLNKSTFDS